MANVTVTSSNPAITVTKSNSVVNVSSTSSTITVSAIASLANANVVRSQVSALDAGGDGSFSYNDTTGVFTYTGPNQTEANARIAAAPTQVRAHLSNTSPIQYNSSTGVIGIDSAALFTGKTTDDLTEGTTNKYFTTTGATVNTDALPEGSTNLYLNGAGTTDDLTEGSTNEYFTTAKARQSISATAPLSYDNVSGVLSITEIGDIEGVTAGSGLTGGGTSGTVTLNVGEGTGISVTGDAVGVNTSSVYNLDHSGIHIRTLNGSGLGGGSNPNNPLSTRLQGAITSNVDLIVDIKPQSGGLYGGLSTDSQGIFVDSTVLRTSGDQNVTSGVKIFDVGTELDLLNSTNTINRIIPATTGLIPPGSTAGTLRVSGDLDVTNNLEVQYNFNFQDTGANNPSITGVNTISTDSTGTAGETNFLQLKQGQAGVTDNDVKLTSQNGVIVRYADAQFPTGTAANTFVIERINATQALVLDRDGHLTTFGNTTFGSDSANTHTFTGNVDVTGNIEVSGNLNYRNVEDLYVRDQKITLNANAATDATVEIIANRPVAGSNTVIRWNETTDKWQFSNDGSTYKDLIGLADIPADAVTSVNGQTGVVVLDTGDLQENGNLFYTDARVDAHLSGGTGITYTAGSIDLDNTAVTPKTYGDAANVPQFTVDQQGRITGVSNVAITGTYANADVQNFLENGYSAANIDANNITAVTFTGDGSDLTSVRAETIEITIKNADTVTIPKGYPVHATGTSVGGEVEVVLADAGNSVLMPAHFIANEELTSTGDTGRGILSGLISGIDTSSFSVGDTIFVAVGGGYANVAPSGEANLIQNLGVVTDVAVSGKGEVYGAGRSAATPALNTGNIFIGNGSNQSVSATLDTSIVPENTNLYYTDSRFDTRLATKTTSDLTEGANLYYTTARANAAILDYTGNIPEVGNIDVQQALMVNDTQTNITTGLHVKSPTLPNFALNDNYIQLATESCSGSFAGSNINALTNQFGLFKIGGETNTGHIGNFWPGKSLLVDQSLYVGAGLNFSRTALNINTRYSESFSHFVGTGAAASGNVYINMAVGQVTGSPAGSVANATVGIKTHDGRGYILGWHDAIDGSVINYDNEPSWSSPSELNGWYAFSDLAKTTVDETFDANLTISGHTALKGFNETVIALGSQSGNIAALAAFNAANGSIFTMTATGGIEISQIPNAIAGSSYTLKITQDGTGSHALTSTFKYQGGDKTLTTAAGNTDVISVVYDGTDYLATLSKDYY